MTARLVDGRYDELNGARGKLIGRSPEELVGRTIREVFPGIEDEWIDKLAGVVDTGISYSFVRDVGVPGRWYEGVSQPAGGERFTTIFSEVTERIETERRRNATLALGDRLRDVDRLPLLGQAFAETVGTTLRASRAGFGIVDDVNETGEMQPDWHAEAVASIAGIYAFLDFGSFIENLRRGETVIVDDVRTDPRTRDHAEAFDAIDVRTLVNVPLLSRDVLAAVSFVHYAEPATWTEADTTFLRDVTDRAQLAVARIQADQRRTVLNQELSHRLKNSLALVSSIVTQMLRSAPDVATLRKTLGDRIQALSKAHDVLMIGQRDAAAVRDVVWAAVSLHDEDDKVHLAGPDVRMGPKAALTMAMIVHELATNAGKYGVLSVGGGHVDVNAQIDEAGAAPVFWFEWREVGGPLVMPPTKKSFGTRMIEMGLWSAAGGASELEYSADGVVCRLVAALRELQTAEEAG